MNVIPRLVKDAETGKLCMQISMGMETATLELPHYLQAQDGKPAPTDAIKEFMEKWVPKITAELHARRRGRIKLTAKKADK